MISIDQYLQKLSGCISGSSATVFSRTVSLSDALSSCIESLQAVRNKGRTVFIIGNGGSAAIASHVQNDLCKGAGIRAMVFHETPLLTAYSNDISYEEAFEQMLGLWAGNGDLLIAISSSGKSKNILNAVEKARGLGCSVITLSGFSPENPLRAMGDVNLYVPSPDYGIVETAHATILHYITDSVKTPMVPIGDPGRDG